MSNLRRVVVILLLVSLCVGLWPPPLQAQLAVEDLGVLAQMYLSVSHMLEMVGLYQEDLSVLVNIGVITELLTNLSVLAHQLEAIGQQISGRSDAWLELAGGAVPCSAAAGRQWFGSASEFAEDGAKMVLKIMSVMAQTTEILKTLSQISSLIGAIVGTTSGLQVASALLAVNTSEMQRIERVMTPAQQAVVAALLIEQRMQRAALCMQDNLFIGWGEMN